MTEFNGFAARCTNSGIELHESMWQAGQTGASGLRYTLEPSGMYAAIVKAGILLREQPSITLANTIITGKALRGFMHTPASRTLTGIINASREPLPGPTLACRRIKIPDICGRAEKFISATILQMLQPDAQMQGYNRLLPHCIISGNDHRIIAIQKGEGEPTCLTFERLIINGIPYPPGSLMDVRFKDEYNGKRYRSRWKNRSAAAPYHIEPMENVAHMGFLRLSAFAVPPLRRAAEFPELGSPPPGKPLTSDYDVIRHWSLDRMRRVIALAASKLVQIPAANR